MILSNLRPFFRKVWVVSKVYCFAHVANTYLIHFVGTFGPGMLPAIDSTSSVFLTERISTRFGKIASGDIVVLRHPQNPKRFMTKRVVGLEGDSVTYIETFGMDVEGDNDTYISNLAKNDKTKTIVVPKGRVWVEGDNKYKSNDSRKYGPVPCGLIHGKIFWRVLPIKDFGPFWNK